MKNTIPFSRFCRRLFALLLMLCALPAAKAEPGEPLGASLHLTHLSADRWRADYQFAEPVESIRFDPVGLYRSKAWRVLTPGLKLVTGDKLEQITRGGKRFSSISVEVTLYLPYEQKNYTPFDRFSDGGTDMYVGFFAGDAQQGKHTRPLQLRVQLTGLPNEHVVPPDARDPAHPDYAYFGPATPAPFGAAKVILDPKMPAWLIPVIEETAAKVTSYFDLAWQRKLPSTPLLLISLDSIAEKGLSIKGGAFDNKIVYRFSGEALTREGNPIVRRYIVELVAHELAHIWQRNASPGGFGNEQWVHEGGAEAIAVEVLEKTGLFSKEEADAYSAKLIAECEQLQGGVDTFRGFYACGFKRFRDYHTDIFALWKNMMEMSEASGEVYSSRMIDTILARRGKEVAAGH